MNHQTDITGIVLAGGKSTRMKKDKGLLPIYGKPMISHCVDALRLHCTEILIIANQDGYTHFGFPVLKDIIKEQGPLGGIYTGLMNTSTAKNMVVSCDTPFVSHALFQLLIEESRHYDVTVPRYQGQIHPLIGVYHRNCLKHIAFCIEQKHLTVKEAIRALHVNEVDLTEQETDVVQGLRNINTPEELKQIVCESYS